MQDFIINTLKNVAIQSGLSEKAFIPKTIRDNITLIKPRIEYSFLANDVKRSGRLLAIDRIHDMRTSKRELYLILQKIQLKLFSDKELFRTSFTNNFFLYLPKGINDTNGNFIKFKYETFEFENEGEKRIGDSVIKVNEPYIATYNLLVTYRVTQTITENYIKDVTINPIIKKGNTYG